MNMFRDILICALIGLALGIGLTDPAEWRWAHLCGDQVVSAFIFLGSAKPYSVIVMLAVALALFMTRLKY